MNRPLRPLPPDLRDALDGTAPDVHRRMEHAWRLLGETPRPPVTVPSGDEAWRALDARLSVPPPAPGSPRRRGIDRPATPPRHRGRHRAYGAGALLAVLVIGALWYRAQPLAVVAPPGARIVVALPDGSAAELNSGTSLRYQRGFERLPFVPSGARRVTLDGEAFFRVEPGARPFVVETFNARVEVLGTSFNVRARRGRFERETHVTVAAGSVRVEPRSSADTAADTAAALAYPGAAVRVTGTDAPRLAAALDVPLRHTLAWRADGFVAVRQPLAVILAEVERQFGLAITADGRVDLAQTMTVVYQRDVTAEQILHDLCLANGLQYRRTSRGYTLVPAARTGRPGGERPEAERVARADP